LDEAERGIMIIPAAIGRVHTKQERIGIAVKPAMMGKTGLKSFDLSD
jgi:hypothetical protein